MVQHFAHLFTSIFLYLVNIRSNSKPSLTSTTFRLEELMESTPKLMTISMTSQTDVALEDQRPLLFKICMMV